VQAELYRRLSSPDSSDITALDGSSGSLFSRVRDALRLAVKEIPDRQSYHQTQHEGLEQFEELTEGLAGATIELLKADLHAPFLTRAHPEQLLRLLKEMCEGHYEPMQDLFHDQPHTIFDIDITMEVCKLLIELEAHLDKANLAQAELACAMLIEVLQGNTSGMNAEMLLETKLLEVCNRLLVKLQVSQAELIEERSLGTLQTNVLTLLHALLESHQEAQQESALSGMKDSLDLSAIAALAGRWYEESLGAHHGAKEEVKPLLERGFLAYTLLRRITDRFPSAAELAYSGMEEHARAHYDAYLGRVEIAHASGKLERVYFRIPAHVLRLSTKTKQKLLWSVDRETPGMAVMEFLLESSNLHVEVVWQMVLSRWRAFKMMVRYEISINFGSIFLAILQNLMLIFNTSIISSIAAETGDPSVQTNWAGVYMVVRYTLGTIQVLTCGCQTMTHFWRSTFLTLLTQYEGGTNHDRDITSTIRLISRPCSHPAFFARFVLLLSYVAATDIVLLRNFFFFVCALLGALVQEEFYVVHLFQVVFADKNLLDVLRAVSWNGKQLLLTFWLFLIVIWAYAVWASELVASGVISFYDNNTCTSPGRCWLDIIDSLAMGGVIEIMDNADYYSKHRDPLDYLNVYGFHFSFFVVVVVVLLNVVFGIIIDTFSELRGEKQAKKAHMENTCFICGIDRFTFDTSGGGFNEHIHNDHWMWTYLALIVHVFEKSPTEYNGWEAYVAGRIDEKDTSFLPRNTALVLQKASEAEEEAQREVSARLAAIEAQNERLMRAVDLLLKDQGKHATAAESRRRSVLAPKS